MRLLRTPLAYYVTRICPTLSECRDFDYSPLKDPVLFLDYLVSLLPDDSFLNQNGLRRWGCIVGVNLGMSYLAYRGMR